MNYLKRIGLVLIILGFLAIGGYTFYQVIIELLADKGVPSIIPLGILAATLGIILVLIAFTNERLTEKKYDDHNHKRNSGKRD